MTNILSLVLLLSAAPAFADLLPLPNMGVHERPQVSSADEKPPLPVQAAPSPAAPEAQPAAPRTTAHLLIRAMKQGVKGLLDAADAAALGFPGGKEVKVLTLDYPAEKTADGRRHQFHLVLNSRERPSEIVWSVVKRTEVEHKKKKRIQIDAWHFRTSPASRLRNAARAEGLEPARPLKVDEKAPETLAAFGAEEKFVVEDCAPLDAPLP